MHVDFSRMKISELIDFAEAQAAKERENLATDADPDRGASWTETLQILKVMKERGIPEPLADKS